ncbi:MAG: 16S rRNA (guanine(966)-N(2))-methyltransferase RsmD [Clostridia bacterium]|nr:16S rRNA (guanine(966)-N(2))-methyltransferase RsmD [Clostridia bacterium]
MRIISGKARGTNLKTLDGLSTRPTLDRVKEPLFSIINDRIDDSIVLDLFSGSGALGLESLSRGAKKAIFCDNSKDANKIIMQNIEKTRTKDKSIVYLSDFRDALHQVKDSGLKPDIVFLDPPYESNWIIEALKLIIELKICNDNSIIIAETDDIDRVRSDISRLNIEVSDIRKYGRVYLIFLKI